MNKTGLLLIAYRIEPKAFSSAGEASYNTPTNYSHFFPHYSLLHTLDYHQSNLGPSRPIHNAGLYTSYFLWWKVFTWSPPPHLLISSPVTFPLKLPCIKMPITSSVLPNHNNKKKYLQILPHVPWGQNCPNWKLLTKICLFLAKRD